MKKSDIEKLIEKKVAEEVAKRMAAIQPIIIVLPPAPAPYVPYVQPYTPRPTYPYPTWTSNTGVAVGITPDNITTSASIGSIQ